MKIDFEKGGGLAPAVIQDARTGRVLMLGYMNEEALQQTRESGRVTFFSRSRQKLWTKGETSGNFLLVESIQIDCDGDALLIKVHPTGPVCHTGADTCFAEENRPSGSFLFQLEHLVQERKRDLPAGSYTSELLRKGVERIAQKVGEEATEVVIAALDPRGRLLEETADLLYHLLVLLCVREHTLSEVVAVLEKRHQKQTER
ncbi:MAG: bifunctional phosphoribosyl-AMP cyclohydrolase/phosphoribosyl-ATP diphosphatase HisIE [Calditrichaeota bacterium]|nr:MAG: bifunctional phosphoribosyl-AMP cyclohydrolase/phosphoribosyl-ATP diphosphatase HisIE [Calditrichota bacterium]